jgi:hypothetical protein
MRGWVGPKIDMDSVKGKISVLVENQTPILIDWNSCIVLKNSVAEKFYFCGMLIKA